MHNLCTKRNMTMGTHGEIKIQRKRNLIKYDDRMNHLRYVKIV